MTQKLEPPTVKDLMVTDVATVSPDASLDDVIKLLIRRNVPDAPVVDEKDDKQELVGFITEKDCLEYFSNEIYYGNPDVGVEAIMQRFPLCVSPDMDVFAIATIFTHQVQRHLPVVKKKQLLGIISLREVLRGLSFSESDVANTVETFRRFDQKRLYDDYAHYTDMEKMQAHARKQNEELEALFNEDSELVEGRQEA